MEYNWLNWSALTHVILIVMMMLLRNERHTSTVSLKPKRFKYSVKDVELVKAGEKPTPAWSQGIAN
ncbi:hypothetical protein KSF78_0007572 [Schistosoma japonicum]|nr:hypothetical protein KSF78_0007572 [Schistosoma japonicum]